MTANLFFFREWLAKGILTVESLIKDGTCFLSYTEFLNKYHCKSCPLAFSGIIATLKTIRMRFKENIDSLETVKVESFSKAFQKTKKPSNLTYRNLVATKSEKPRASQAKWYRDCNLNEEEIDWKKTFVLTRTCTKSTKIIIFHFKFLHRHLPTNSFLHKIAIKDNDLCTFWKEETDTLLHLFWQCKVTSHFWGSFFQWLQTSAFIQKGRHLAMTTALGLKPDSSKSNLQIWADTIFGSVSWEMKPPTFHNFCAFSKKLMKSKQTDSTSSLKNGNLSLATFKGLRMQKVAKLKSRDLCQWYYWHSDLSILVQICNRILQCAR